MEPFLFGAVPVGSYILTASAPGYTSISLAVTVRGGRY
jgi:hypothetical protein